MTSSFQVLQFASPTAGKKLLILGAVHGNETCGTQAIQSVLPDFLSGKRMILSGSVTFVPCCNIHAYEKNVRYIDRNLNRELEPKKAPSCYEDQLCNLLCPVLAECDYLLDLHSYHSTGPAFIFANHEQGPEVAFRRCLGPTIELFKWNETYARILGNPDQKTSNGTTEYVHSFGKVGVTVECGHHNDPSSVDVARLAIDNALKFCGIVEGTAPSYPQTLRVELSDVIWRQEGWEFVKPWVHLDRLTKGQVLAKHPDGQEIRAAQDGYMILPKLDCPIGDEWFYLGV